MQNIAFIITHPIQYSTPLYRKIAKEPDVVSKVFFASDESVRGVKDKQFGVEIKWDIPMLEGYDYEFIKNNSYKPSIFNGFFGLMNWGIVRKIIKLPKKSIVIIHGWNYFYYLISLITAKLCGHIVCIRGENPLKQEIKKNRSLLFIKSFVLRGFIFSWADKFLYIGSENKAFYSFYKIKDKNLIFTPYSVDNERFRVSYTELKPRKAELKATLGIPSDSVVILNISKYITKKNPLDLLSAYKDLKQENKALLMVGEGEMRVEMEEYIQKNNLKNVFLTGFINQLEISKYYAVADVFVMCSGMGETWGLAVNEAMNFDLPIVVSDLTGCSKDLVQEGLNGYVFPTNNTRILSEKLALLIADEEKRKQMGLKSGEIVKSYTYEKIIENLKTIH